MRRSLVAACLLLPLALPAAAQAAAPICNPASCSGGDVSTRSVVLKKSSWAKSRKAKQLKNRPTSLRVSVKFAPKGSKPRVTVTGPKGFKRTLSTSRTFRKLQPGRYVITAAPVKGKDLTTYATYQVTKATLRKGVAGWVGVRYRAQVSAATLVAQPSAITKVVGDDANATRTITVNDPQQLIKVGSVITAGVGPETPSGLLVEVTALTRNGAAATVQADPAPLTAIGPMAEISEQPQLKMTSEEFSRMVNADPKTDPGAFKQNSLKEFPTDGRSFGLKKKGGDGFEKPYKCSRAGATIDGDVSFDAGTDVGISWGGFWHPLTINAHVGVTIKQSANLVVTVSGQAKCELELELLPEDYRFTPWQFAVGPVPVVIVPKLNFLVNGEASVEASTSIEVNQSLETSFGLQYDGDNVGPYGRAEAKYESKFYAPSGSAQLKASVGPKLMFDFYDVAGPYLTAGIYVQPKADTAKTPWWRLSAGLEAGGGFRFKVWKFSFDRGVPDIWSKDWTLAEAKTPAPLTLDTAALPAGDAGKAYSAAIKTARGKANRFYVTEGAVPAGLSFNQSTGTITGVPSGHGASTFKVAALDAEGHIARGERSITIRTAPIALTTTTLPEATKGAAYRGELVATGSAEPYAWTIASGALPGGLSLVGGQLIGTPEQTGTFPFTVMVKGVDGKSATRAFTLSVVAPKLEITTSSVGEGMEGVVFAKTLAATGGEGDYTWSLASGTLPAGVTLNAAGELAGRPTAQGDSSFTVKVADTTGHEATRQLSLHVYPPGMVISAPVLPNVLQGDDFSATLSTIGGSGPYTWAVTTGTLPAGLALNAATGAITGQPSAGGITTFTVTATDSTGAQATKDLQIDVTGEPSGTPVSLAYVDCWSATGCLAVGYQHTYKWDGTTWTLAQGTVPGHAYNPTSLSCYDATRCGMSAGGDVYVWDGTAWTFVNRPAISHGGSSNGVMMVSCFSSTTCEAQVDEEVGSTDQGYSYRLTGTSWGRNIALPEGNMYGLDCIGSSFCAAVQPWDGLTTSNGSAWGAIASASIYHTDISCATPTSCLIVDGHSDKTVTWNGSLQTPISSGTGGISYTVDCVVAGSKCASAWRVSGGSMAGIWDGTTWTTTPKFNGVNLNSVACPTDSLCLAVGDNARWYVWDGTSWKRKRGFAYD